jgi:hypothetical protein
MAPQESPRRRKSAVKKEKQATRSRRGGAPAAESLAQAGVEPGPQGERREAPAPGRTDLALGPNVLDVRLLREGRPQVAALSVGLHETAIVQVRFVLRGADAHGLAAEESPFQVRVYAEDVTSGARSDVASHNAHLAKGSLEYELRMPALVLPMGLYRLVTVVSLEGPVRAIDYHEGPIVTVTSESPSASADTRAVPLPR